MTKHNILVVAACILIVGAVAAVASYATRESIESKREVATAPAPVKQRVAAAQPVKAQPAPECDDKNIVGTVAGGVGGALVGSQIGKGSGKTAAIVGGGVGGAVLGNQFIPTRNVTCP